MIQSNKGLGKSDLWPVPEVLTIALTPQLPNCNLCTWQMANIYNGLQCVVVNNHNLQLSQLISKKRCQLGKLDLLNDWGKNGHKNGHKIMSGHVMTCLLTTSGSPTKEYPIFAQLYIVTKCLWIFFCIASMWLAFWNSIVIELPTMEKSMWWAGPWIEVLSFRMCTWTLLRRFAWGQHFNSLSIVKFKWIDNMIHGNFEL